MASPDFFSMAAQRKMGEGWLWRRSEVVEGGFILTGAKPIGFFTRGPRKGAPKFPHPSAYQKVILTRPEIDAVIAEWESSTGWCHRCDGGQECYGFNEQGSLYRPCKRCNATQRNGAEALETSDG